MKKLIQYLILVAFFSFFSNSLSYTQINIIPGPDITPQDMVESIAGEGITFDNIYFQGADISRGVFSDGNTTNLGLESGIFLTSGAGFIIPGPNSSISAGVYNGTPGNPTLNGITTYSTHDASVLEFDFIPESDTLMIKYVFGSEEYVETGALFSDVFGFFVTGPNPLGGYYSDENIALIPGTLTPVSGYTINNNSYPEYFIDNINGLTLEYDGLTTVLTAVLPIVRWETYHIKIGIADAADGLIDSGIFLKENSLTSPGPALEVEVILDPPDISQNLIEGHVEADIIFKLTSTDFTPMFVNFEVTGTANPNSWINGGDFEEAIPTFVYFDEGEDSVSFHIAPVQDASIEGSESIVLIIEYNIGPIFKYDTVEIIIEDYLDMLTLTSPNSMIFNGQEIDLWVQVYNGYPPYSYLWEPGGYTTDAITVSPEETTTYTVTCFDSFQDTVVDSVLVTVVPCNSDILSFSFETEDNLSLPWSVTGQIFEDSVMLEVPVGTNLENLIATFSSSIGASVYVNGSLQVSGETSNDFTNPVIYNVIAMNGDIKDWMVNVDVVTGSTGKKDNEILVYPNPATDIIQILVANGYEVAMLNNLGKEFIREDIYKNPHTIDVGHLEEGIYFLWFVKDETTFLKKVVISR